MASLIFLFDWFSWPNLNFFKISRRFEKYRVMSVKYLVKIYRESLISRGGKELKIIIFNSRIIYDLSLFMMFKLLAKLD